MFRLRFHIFLVIIFLSCVSSVKGIAEESVKRKYSSLELRSLQNPFIIKLPKEPPKPEYQPVIKKALKDNIPKIDWTNKNSNKINQEINNIKDSIKDNIQQPPPKIPPTFVVSGIIWNSKKPQAIIDDQIVEIGQIIQEAKITHISPSGIKYSFDGKNFIATLKKDDH